MPATASRLHPALPGLAAAAAAALVAGGVHALVPAIPLLTVAVALGIVAAQIPAARPALTGPLKPGLTLASKRLMRIGVVLLGLQLGLSDIVGLGWRAVLLVVAVVVLSFAGTSGCPASSRSSSPPASPSAGPARSARWPASRARSPPTRARPWRS
jgi:uncharacterized membrane protein YadS